MQRLLEKKFILADELAQELNLQPKDKPVSGIRKKNPLSYLQCTFPSQETQMSLIQAIWHAARIVNIITEICAPGGQLNLLKGQMASHQIQS